MGQRGFIIRYEVERDHWRSVIDLLGYANPCHQSPRHRTPRQITDVRIWPPAPCLGNTSPMKSTHDIFLLVGRVALSVPFLAEGLRGCHAVPRLRPRQLYHRRQSQHGRRAKPVIL